MNGDQFYYRSVSPQTIIKYAFWIIPLIIILVLAGTSFYMVNTDSRGVVQRFGRFDRITEPGLHFKLPLGIERVQKPQVMRIFKEEFGFSTLRAGIKTAYGKKSLDESLMLCGDLSVAEVEWIVQFKIKEPDKYLFNIRNQRQVIRDTSESVMRMVVGDSSVDEVLTARRVEINIEAQQKVQEILDNYNTGIQMVTVKLQDVNPPEPVKPAFNEVNAAQQDKERLVNKAWEEYNKVIPKARGQALQMVKQAEGYAINRTNTAIGDAKRFNRIWAEYNQNKDVTRRRLYLESLGKILPKLEKKYIIDDQVKGLLPLLNIGKE